MSQACISATMLLVGATAKTLDTSAFIAIATGPNRPGSAIPQPMTRLAPIIAVTFVSHAVV